MPNRKSFKHRLVSGTLQEESVELARNIPNLVYNMQYPRKLKQSELIFNGGAPTTRHHLIGPIILIWLPYKPYDIFLSVVSSPQPQGREYLLPEVDL